MAGNINFFNKEEVATYPKNTALPMAIRGLNDSLFFTTFQGSSDRNYQINYAFNNDAFIYVFGDKLSVSRIEGIAFPKQKCTGEDSTVDSSPKKFVQFYNKYKVGSTKTDKPLQITIGGMALSGYFTNLAISLVSGKQNTYTFSFTFLGRVH